MANSSATRSGGLYSGRALPMTMSATPLVRRREAGGDQVRRRHQAVGVLVVLVDADAVEAQLAASSSSSSVSLYIAFARPGSNRWLGSPPTRSRTSRQSRPAGAVRA